MFMRRETFKMKSGMSAKILRKGKKETLYTDDFEKNMDRKIIGGGID